MSLFVNLVYDCVMSPIFEFHISRRTRDRYQFADTLFATDGRVVLADFGTARRFADQVFAVSGRLIPASDIYAMGLIDEILHLVIRLYEKQKPEVLSHALSLLEAHFGPRLDDALIKFTDEFPPTPVYRSEISIDDYLRRSIDGRPLRLVSIEEMLLLNISNRNPAVEPYKEFFDDSVLSYTAYQDSVHLLGDYLSRQQAFGNGAGTRETLYDALLGPSKASPYSLEGQLQYLLEKWGPILGTDLIQRLLRAMDFVREEVIRHTGPGGFAGSAPLIDYRGEPEYERYSQDKDWMPRIVLLARNTYVWLEQLSRKNKRWIKTLDQIPNEELDLLASRGFTGLWLIGLWERSRASKRIKQRMGQEDAVASAYSLFSYDIASDLGGWPALHNLRSRAWQRGIRLSADMVPNHMGIDSSWVVEHPDWFLSIDRPPYPSYSFNSENLSEDPRVGIFIDDHYYDKTDAAVVFQLRNNSSHSTQYVYHGNDGTSFPWNDTAQLDYSKSEVREAVIQTILHVARNFPVIRFDAAMTLARKHIQRLWFPEPGTGGAIPSRAEHGMTRSEFDACIPNEFWREVVDRVAAEVPDTLLLAEAFWLMEGYFVRTLGMHRVYNSAFMHMLRDEDNAKYRLAIKNTLEFDPQILKRYVNFMSNPDEKTAIEQFGTGDKYFGVCTLLVTLPGLPMFGHGQVEGLREKYGMEFRMPKWDEIPDEALIRGHEWKIFPLLHRRDLFAGVDQFYLYDLFTSAGKVDENVFAFSNRLGTERGLVVYHNKFSETRGWIKSSAAFLDKGAGRLMQTTLAEGLGLPSDGYVIFRDYVTHLEYIRSCHEVWRKGLYVELSAYEHHSFLDWRFVGDEWKEICDSLSGKGVPDVEATRQQMLQRQTPEVIAEPVLTKAKPKKKSKTAVPKKSTLPKSAATRKKAGVKSVSNPMPDKKTGKVKVNRLTSKKSPLKSPPSPKKRVR